MLFSNISMPSPGRRDPDSYRFFLSLFASLAGIALFFAPAKAFACASCGCTVSTDWETQGITSRQGYAVEFSYDYINQNQYWYGTSRASTGIPPAAALYLATNQTYGISTPPRHAYVQQLVNNGLNNNEDELKTINQTINSSVAYTGENWGVVATIPMINRHHTTNGSLTTVNPDATYTYAIPGVIQGYYHQTQDVTALGDAKILFRYSGFLSDNSVGLLYGVKLPTGSTTSTFNGGAALDRGLQPGSGSTDVIVGAYIAGAIQKFSLFARGLFQHAVFTTGDFRPGDTFIANLGVRYGSFGQMIAPMLQLNISSTRPDSGNNSQTNQTSGACADYKCLIAVNAVSADLQTFDGGRTLRTDVYGNPLSGNQTVYVAPGLMARLGEGTILFGFYQLAVYKKVNSLQLTPKDAITLGVRQYF